jgi:hypothetical protein
VGRLDQSVHKTPSSKHRCCYDVDFYFGSSDTVHASGVSNAVYGTYAKLYSSSRESCVSSGLQETRASRDGGPCRPLAASQLLRPSESLFVLSLGTIVRVRFGDGQETVCLLATDSKRRSWYPDERRPDVQSEQLVSYRRTSPPQAQRLRLPTVKRHRTEATAKKPVAASSA